jgi:hypothetical protein
MEIVQYAHHVFLFLDKVESPDPLVHCLTNDSLSTAISADAARFFFRALTMKTFPNHRPKRSVFVTISRGILGNCMMDLYSPTESPFSSSMYSSNYQENAV